MRATLLCTIFLFPFLLSAQSPWPRSKAGFYTQVAWHFIPEYSEVFVPEGEYHVMDRALSEGTLEWYGEYGLGSRTTITGILPIRFLKNGEFLNNFAEPNTQEGSLSGFGNISLGIRHQFNKGSMPITGSLRTDFAASAYNDATGLRTGYNALTFLPMLSTGKGYGKYYWFVYGGYGLRTSNYSDFLNVGAEGGLKAGKVWIVLFSQWLQPMRNGNIELPYNNRLTSLYVNDQGWVSVGIKGMVEINRFWGAVVSFAGAASGQWVPASPGIGAGVYFKWD